MENIYLLLFENFIHRFNYCYLKNVKVLRYYLSLIVVVSRFFAISFNSCENIDYFVDLTGN